MPSLRSGRMRIKWTRRALSNLQAIADYISQDSPRAAQKVVSRIRVSARMLPKHPKMGRSGRVAGIREFVVSGTPYIVAYRIHENRLEILAVIHGARQWPENF